MQRKTKCWVRNVWTANCQTYIMKLYWLKGSSNLVLVLFKPSEKLSHIKVGCSGDCNIGKVSMTSARHNSQILKYHQLIFNRSLCTVRLGNPVDVGCFVEWPLDFMYTSTWLGYSEDGFCCFVCTHVLHNIFGWIITNFLGSIIGNVLPSPPCQFTKRLHVSCSAISSETIALNWTMLMNISMDYFVKEFDDLK